MSKTVTSRQPAVFSFLFFVCLGALSTAQPAANTPIALDVSDIGRPDHGFFVVRKGLAYSVMNANGEVVVPWRSYDQIEDVHNGYCIVRKNNRLGMLRLRGRTAELVLPLAYNEIRLPDVNECTVVADFSLTYYAVDLSTGKQLKLGAEHKGRVQEHDPGEYFFGSGAPARDVVVVDTVAPGTLPFGAMPRYSRRGYEGCAGNGLVAFETMKKREEEYGIFWDPTGEFGYMDLSGKVIVPAVYCEVGKFTDGLAAVAKRDEFGEIRYGFIDPKGEVIIPFKYRRRPGAFHHGLADVYPAEVADFKYAYINKRDEVVFKVYHDCGNDRAFCDAGFVLAGVKEDGPCEIEVFDTSGNQVGNMKERLGRKPAGCDQYKVADEGLHNGHLFVTSVCDGPVGHIDLRTGELTLPPKGVRSTLAQDSVSGLFLATIKNDDGTGSRKALVDVRGNVHYIAKSQSTW